MNIIKDTLANKTVKDSADIMEYLLSQLNYYAFLERDFELQIFEMNFNGKTRTKAYREAEQKRKEYRAYIQTIHKIIRNNSDISYGDMLKIEQDGAKAMEVAWELDGKKVEGAI